MEKELDLKALEKRRAYYREWRRKNKEKVKQYNESYWLKKSLEDIQNKLDKVEEAEGVS